MAIEIREACGVSMLDLLLEKENIGGEEAVDLVWEVGEAGHYLSRSRDGRPGTGSK